VINNTGYSDNDPNYLKSFTSTQSTSGQVTNLINNITVIKYHGSFQVTKTLSVDACPGFSTTVTALAQATLVAPPGYDEDTQTAPDHSDSVTDPYRYCNATTSFQIQIAAVPTKQPTPSPSTSPTKFPTLPPTKAPTLPPSKSPTILPTLQPSKAPTNLPTLPPSLSPTAAPTLPEIAANACNLTVRKNSQMPTFMCWSLMSKDFYIFFFKFVGPRERLHSRK
jgi:hypothetical protein